MSRVLLGAVVRAIADVQLHIPFHDAGRLRIDQPSRGTGAMRFIGIGAQPVSEPPQPACDKESRRWPHFEHRQRRLVAQPTE